VNLTFLADVGMSFVMYPTSLWQLSSSTPPDPAGSPAGMPRCATLRLQPSPDGTLVEHSVVRASVLAAHSLQCSGRGHSIAV